MRLLTEQRHDDLVETAFSLDDDPGILWTPTTPAAATTPSRWSSSATPAA